MLESKFGELNADVGFRLFDRRARRGCRTRPFTHKIRQLLGGNRIVESRVGRRGLDHLADQADEAAGVVEHRPAGSAGVGGDGIKNQGWTAVFELLSQPLGAERWKTKAEDAAADGN